MDLERFKRELVDRLVEYFSRREFWEGVVGEVFLRAGERCGESVDIGFGEGYRLVVDGGYVAVVHEVDGRVVAAREVKEGEGIEGVKEEVLKAARENEARYEGLRKSAPSKSVVVLS